MPRPGRRLVLCSRDSLRAEGNSAARELDLNKVGVDKAETEKAAKVLNEGHADVRERTMNPVGVEVSALTKAHGCRKMMRRLLSSRMFVIS